MVTGKLQSIIAYNASLKAKLFLLKKNLFYC